MREIKFRAWDKIANDMLQNIQNHINDEIFAFGYMIKNPERFSIMQFTGLKDKNGVDVFEEDIIRHPKATEPEDSGWIVKWSCERYRFECELSISFIDEATGENLMTPFYDYFSHCEVIGNIYQNPELLEKFSST